MSENSSSDTHNTGKKLNNTDRLSIGTEVPIFAHSQHLDQVHTQLDCCMCETAHSELPSTPTRAAAPCSALRFPVNKVQAASCKFQMLFTFTSLQSKRTSQFNQEIFSRQLFDTFRPTFLILRSAKMAHEPENIFAAIVWHFTRNSK